MQTITPHLWFDTQAREAAGFYTSVFENSRINNVTTLNNTPSGSVDVVTLELAGQSFMFISAGPMFKFNPSISFLVSCATKEEVDALWRELSAGGTPMMELGAYPFSERYGWIQDRYGLSWQLMYAGGRPIAQKITPTLMFVGGVLGKAEEAIGLYTSVFPNSSIGDILRWDDGTIKYAQFVLDGQRFSAMDGPGPHNFAFNEAISLLVRCETQEQIDYYWERLSADPNAEMCGWLKDKFGLSWQITATAMDEIFASGDARKIARVTEAFLKMKKFDLAKLREASEAA